MLTAMRHLARCKRLRGTAFDPFGYSAERRLERRLIAEYEGVLDEVLQRVSAANHEIAVELARLPEQIRGFGHVKERHLAVAKERGSELLAALRAPESRLSAAE
jgi:indolepyruvate ferredoxin oxidoreductase